jgi:hypothetical protein
MVPPQTSVRLTSAPGRTGTQAMARPMALRRAEECYEDRSNPTALNPYQHAVASKSGYLIQPENIQNILFSVKSAFFRYIFH